MVRMMIVSEFTTTFYKAMANRMLVSNQVQCNTDGNECGDQCTDKYCDADTHENEDGQLKKGETIALESMQTRGW